jgi:hypothetical protein
VVVQHDCQNTGNTDDCTKSFPVSNATRARAARPRAFHKFNQSAQLSCDKQPSRTRRNDGRSDECAALAADAGHPAAIVGLTLHDFFLLPGAVDHLYQACADHARLCRVIGRYLPGSEPCSYYYDTPPQSPRAGELGADAYSAHSPTSPSYCPKSPGLPGRAQIRVNFVRSACLQIHVLYASETLCDSVSPSL